jgi:hypothetical protein
MKPDALRACITHLEREWGTGDDGYTIHTVQSAGASRTMALVEAGHSDGSRFWIIADRYGQVTDGDTAEEACARMGTLLDAAKADAG